MIEMPAGWENRTYNEAQSAYSSGRWTREQMINYVREWRHRTFRYSDVGRQYHFCDECRGDD